MNGLLKFENFVLGLQNNGVKKLDSEGNVIDVTFEFNTPANNSEISKVEQELGKLLPQTYRDFLLKYNGARIFDYEGLDGFVFLGTEDIVKTNKFVADTFEEDWLDNLIIFAKYIGEGNFLAFDSDTEEYKVVDCFVEELPQNWNEIACNFDAFLEKILNSQGSKYWL